MSGRHPLLPARQVPKISLLSSEVVKLTQSILKGFQKALSREVAFCQARKKSTKINSGPGDLPVGVGVEKLVPSLESSFHHFETQGTQALPLGCFRTFSFAGMSWTPGGDQKVSAKNRVAPVRLRFGYGLGMERFERFRFSVPAVLLRRGCLCFAAQFHREDGSGSGFGSWKTVPAVPVRRSVPAKTVPAVPVYVPVRFLGHPEKVCARFWGHISGTLKTGRPGYRTMEMNGGSSASYLARTPCNPFFCTLFNRGWKQKGF